MLPAKFSEILCIKTGDIKMPKIGENLTQQRHLLRDIHQNPLSPKLYQGITEYKISLISVHQFLRYSAKIFWRHTYLQTARHFLNMVKLCSGNLETCKSIENQMLKIFANSMLSSYVYRRKQKRSLTDWILFILFSVQV